jgi:hypothetical protein
VSVSAARRDHRSPGQYDVVNPIEHRTNLANAGTVHDGRLPHADEVVWRELLFQVRDGFPQQVTVAGGVYAGVVSRGFDPQHVGNGDKENPLTCFVATWDRSWPRNTACRLDRNPRFRRSLSQCPSGRNDCRRPAANTRFPAEASSAILHRNEFRIPSATPLKRQLPPDRRDVCVPGSWCERVQTTRSCRSPLLKDPQRRPSYEHQGGQNSQSGCCRELGLDFRWRHAHLRKGLSGGDRSCHQRQGSDHESLDHGSNKHESFEDRAAPFVFDENL